MSSRNDGASDAATRMLKLAQLLYSGGAVTARLIRDVFAVSWPTAKRDMVKLEQCLPVNIELIDTSNGSFLPMKRISLRKSTR